MCCHGICRTSSAVMQIGSRSRAWRVEAWLGRTAASQGGRPARCSGVLGERVPGVCRELTRHSPVVERGDCRPTPRWAPAAPWGCRPRAEPRAGLLLGTQQVSRLARNQLHLRGEAHSSAWGLCCAGADSQSREAGGQRRTRVSAVLPGPTCSLGGRIFPLGEPAPAPPRALSRAPPSAPGPQPLRGS